MTSWSELRAYAEHRHDGARFVLVTLAGDVGAVDAVLDEAWNGGVRVLQVERPGRRVVVS